MKHVLSAIFLLILLGCVVQEKIQSESLQEAQPTKTVEIQNGETFELEAKIVAKEIAGNKINMFGYNGQIPGPLLKVKQNSTITINFKNSLDMPTTVHWHGIRVENKYDGTPDVTQEPVKPGETFTYELRFPDEGVYWYHPHIREDMQQELGLYGNIIVEPAKEDYYNNVDEEEAIFLDDISLYRGQPEYFAPDYANRALMGRFGNTMLINGQTEYALNVEAGQTVRFYLTDSANTRMFNISIDGAELKVVGGDSGLYEKEFLADSVILSPSERAIVEVTFEKPGEYKLMHINPEKSYVLGTIYVTGEKTKQTIEVHNNENIIKSIDGFREYFDAQPDFEIDLDIEMDMGGMGHDMEMMGSMMTNKKLEWEDDMAMMNAMSTSENTKWIMRDKKTGKENMDAVYEAKVGDVKKIRLFNDPKSMHPMQHPIHLHGQRFLVLSENGKKNTNLVWKDSVMVPIGATVDILVDFSNPGDWMIHCHISEHLEAGMMSMFRVSP